MTATAKIETAAPTAAPEKKDGKPTGTKVEKVEKNGRQTIEKNAAFAAMTAKAKKALPFPETAKIKILVESNPKRPGSKGAARFDLYRNGMTVAQAVKAGVTAKDLVWDADHKFISIK